MMTPEELGRLVHGALERLGLEALDVEPVVDGDATASDLQSAWLVVRHQEDRLPVAEGTARRHRSSRERAGLGWIRRGPDEPCEQTAEVRPIRPGEHTEERVPLGVGQRRQRRGERTGGLVALQGAGREPFEGRGQASALKPWRAGSWSRAAHAPPVPRVPRESNHGSARQPSLTTGADGV